MRKVSILVSLIIWLFIVPLVAIPMTHAQAPIIGEIRLYSGYGDYPPDGWLWCKGTPLSSTVYPELFAVISATYGTGGGDPTKDFNLPNLTWKFPVGAYPGLSCGGVGFCPELGDTGGEADHILTEGEMPAHRHSGVVRQGVTADYYATYAAAGSASNTGLGNNIDYVTDYIGNSQPHNNIPPYAGISFIIAYTNVISAIPTPTPTITPTISATPVISVYTYTLDSGTILTVPAQITLGQVVISAIGLSLLAVFVLTFTFRLIHRQ